MVFQPGATEPAASPVPSPNPQKAGNPSEAIETFFATLRGGQIDAAYDALVSDSIIADRRDDVAGLKNALGMRSTTSARFRATKRWMRGLWAPVSLRRTCISLNSDLPLRWRFYFYKSEGTWKLVDLRVDDALIELFEEASRARK